MGREEAGGLVGIQLGLGDDRARSRVFAQVGTKEGGVGQCSRGLG